MGAYSYSKIGINLMTKIQQKEFDEQGADDIIVNCVSLAILMLDWCQI